MDYDAESPSKHTPADQEPQLTHGPKFTRLSALTAPVRVKSTIAPGLAAEVAEAQAISMPAPADHRISVNAFAPDCIDRIIDLVTASNVADGAVQVELQALMMGVGKEWGEPVNGRNFVRGLCATVVVAPPIVAWPAAAITDILQRLAVRGLCHKRCKENSLSSFLPSNR
ncbi:hypothetical protein DFH07DRAFT_783320 [Mycena maculata]|uniref:Uncharacterized protein n=1 Tax=Mycena maculata TaxID=230809 RepID=A0AAD7HNJ9_9AGAR|nr:hypothetical protein DFH07DRAFT_783320 [Mycena maculata]